MSTFHRVLLHLGKNFPVNLIVRVGHAFANKLQLLDPGVETRRRRRRKEKRVSGELRAVRCISELNNETDRPQSSDLSDWFEK